MKNSVHCNKTEIEFSLRINVADSCFDRYRQPNDNGK